MKTLRPTSPGRRQTALVLYRQVLTAGRPHKSLTAGFQRARGRASSGRITVRHQGGGHKRRFRQIDFRYDKIALPARVETLEYDPNRTGFIALVLYPDGERRYVLAPGGARVGDQFTTSSEAELKTGNRLPLGKIPVGTFVFNLEVHPGGGAKLVRSAGNLAEVLSHDAGYTTVKLPSTELRRLSSRAWASIGSVSNEENRLISLGKAGRARWRGIRPTVRGSAMNPVDHPYGGGEGRAGRGLRRAKSLWGKPTGGVKTRKKKKYSDPFRVSRRQSQRRRH